MDSAYSIGCQCRFCRSRTPESGAHALSRLPRSARGPSPSRFHPSAWRAAACALAAVFALLLGAGAVQAQTASKLVGNTGQTRNLHSDFRWHIAQAFTTGSHTLGYKLTRADLRLQLAQGAQPTYTVQIYSADSSGNPDTSLGTLTTSTNLAAGWQDIQFTASGDGIDLAADTTYLVVLAATAGATEYTRWADTSTTAEDSGGAAGWSIENKSRFRSGSTGLWSISPGVLTTPFQLAVHGYAKNNAPTVANAIPHQAATVGTAFSYQFPANTFHDVDTLSYTATKGDGSALSTTWLSFDANTRTFSGTPTTAGTVSVKVTASDGTASVSDTFNIAVLAAGAAPTPIGVEISSRPSHDANDDGTPETYTLGKIVQVQVTFSRAVTVTGTPRIKMKFDPTFGEKWLDYESGSGSRVLTFAYKVVSPNISTQGIAVLQNTLELNGGTIGAGTVNAVLTHTGLGHDANHKVDAGATSPPALVSATVNGRTLTMTFDEALAIGVNPAGSAFEVTATPTGGTARTIAGTGTSAISGRTVTVTLASAVAQGETVTVSYTKPATSPLTGASSGTSRTESFTGKPVTNNTGAAATPQSPANPRLRFASGFGPLRLEPGVAMTPATLPAATGGGGAPYTYSLTSEPARLAGLSFDAGRRTLSGTPEAEGRWTFTWTAQDGNFNTARLTFRVTVGVAFEEQQQVVKRTLAAVASRTVAGAVANIGTRLGGAVPAPGLTIAGETVPFGAPGTADAGATERRGAACPPDARERDVPGTGARGCARARGRGVAADAVLPTSAFSLALGAAEGESGFDPNAPRWGLWGRGDFGSFEGRADAISRYKGETRTGWLGLDAREPERSGRPGRWVAGLAVSRGTSETDYDLEGEKGRIETGLTAVWPYGRWTFENGLELRGMLGAGWGEARHAADDGTREKSRLRMWAGSVGLRHPLPPVAGIALAAQGDASFARMQTAKGGEAVDGLRADAWRLRAGLEAARQFALEDGGSLTPFLAAAARQDGGDGVTGTGLELAGGLRYAFPGVAVELRGRWLAAHTEKGTRERGVSATVRMQPEPDGRGLSLSLNPRWGAPPGAAGALWREGMPQPRAGAREAGALEGELGYGLPLFGGRFTGTPNLGFGLSNGGARDYRIGWRLTSAVEGDPGFRVDLDATRREPAGPAPPEHGIVLHGTIRW